MGVYLTKPNKKKNSSDNKTSNYLYGTCSMQGWRITMEDKHLAIPNFFSNFSLFAIFDGHGSDETSKFCKENFAEILKQNSNLKKDKIKLALEESFLKLDNLLKSEKESKKYEISGCTANILLFNKKKYYIANIGDSRTILHKKNKEVISLSIDHKPELKSERRRIIKAGAFIKNGRVNNCLNLTRSFGDLRFKKNFRLKAREQAICAFPDVFEGEFFGDEDFFLMGCDGIFEEKSNREICQRICFRFLQNPFVRVSVVLEDLFDWLLGENTFRGVGCDNMSSILIKFFQ